MTYSWALDAHEVGVRVNAMSPVAATSMTTTTDFQAQLVANTPPPEAMAPLALYLISDLSEGITGQFFRFNGRDLHIVGHPFVKEPVVSRNSWDLSTITSVIDSELGPHLEQVGVWGYTPPRLAEALAESRIHE